MAEHLAGRDDSATDILEAIIFASDKCEGHIDCTHSMLPWMRARLFLAEHKWHDSDLAEEYRKRIEITASWEGEMKRRTMKNRFDVQVVFPDIAFGIKNQTDIDLTPEMVADELEEFCRRIRNGGKVVKPPERAA